MSQLTVKLVTGTGVFYVPTGDQVFDGLNFIDPEKAQYVVLYQPQVLSKGQDIVAQNNMVAFNIYTSSFLRSQVLGFANIDGPYDPSLIVAPPPVDTCVCALTCSGPLYKFVTVEELP